MQQRGPREARDAIDTLEPRLDARNLTRDARTLRRAPLLQ
jgi:hypothetical protein